MLATHTEGCNYFAPHRPWILLRITFGTMTLSLSLSPSVLAELSGTLTLRPCERCYAGWWPLHSRSKECYAPCTHMNHPSKQTSSQHRENTCMIVIPRIVTKKKRETILLICLSGCVLTCRNVKHPVRGTDKWFVLLKKVSMIVEASMNTETVSPYFAAEIDVHKLTTHANHKFSKVFRFIVSLKQQMRNV